MFYFDSFSLSHFIADIFKQSRVSYSILLTALIYLMRFKYKLDLGIANNTLTSIPFFNHNFISLMFLLSLVISSKFLLDRHPSNPSWSMISGITNEELKRGEVYFLSIIDYRLHVQKDTFSNWTGYIFDPKKLYNYQIKVPLCYSPSPDSSILSWPSNRKTKTITTAIRREEREREREMDNMGREMIRNRNNAEKSSINQIKIIKDVSPCP